MNSDRKSRPEKSTRKNAEESDQIEEKIFRMIIENAYISRKMLSAEIGLSDSSTKRRLEKLVNEGKTRRIGPDKGGHWEVIE